MTIKQAAAIGCFLLASSAFCLDAYADVPDNLRQNDTMDILKKTQKVGAETHEYFHYVDQQADFLSWDFYQVVAEGKGIINSSNHSEETCTILQPSFSDGTTEYDVIYGAYAGEYVLASNYYAKLFHTAKACGNVLNLQGDYLKSRILWGAYASTKYIFQNEGADFKNAFAYADGNTVTINNASTSAATVGAYAVSGHFVDSENPGRMLLKYAASADGNTVCVTGGEHGSVIGSMASLDEIYFGWETGCPIDDYRDKFKDYLQASVSSVSSSGNTLILKGGKYTYNSDTIKETDEAPFTSFGITAGAVYLNAIDTWILNSLSLYLSKSRNASLAKAS